MPIRVLTLESQVSHYALVKPSHIHVHVHVGVHTFSIIIGTWSLRISFLKLYYFILYFLFIIGVTKNNCITEGFPIGFYDYIIIYYIPCQQGMAW